MAVVISEELFQEIKFVLHIFRMFGFSPIQIRKCKDNNNVKLKFSLSCMIYSYILGIALTTFTSIGVIKDLLSENSIKFKNKSMLQVTLLRIFSIISTIFIGMLVAPLKLKYFWRLLKCFQDIDSQFATTRTNTKKHNSMTWLLIIIVILSTAIYFFDFYLWWQHTFELGRALEFFELHIGYYYFCIVISVGQFPYGFYAKLIKRRAENVNGFLNKAFLRLERRKFRHFQRRTLGDEFNERSTKNMWSTNNTSTYYNQRVSYGDGDINLKNLAIAMRAMRVFDDAIENNNKLNDIIIGMVLFNNMLQLVVGSYLFLSEVIVRGYGYFVLDQLLIILLYLGRLFMLVEHCQDCINEKSRTLNLVSLLLSAELDPKIKRLLRQFAFQLCYKNIYFSALGVTEINRVLLSTFSVSLTTFLVILFQFNEKVKQGFIVKS